MITGFRADDHNLDHRSVMVADRHLNIFKTLKNMTVAGC
jgi:hypothetical protein